MIERTFLTEIAAKQQRRLAIECGHEVSLLAFDADRGLYVFDNYSV